MRTPWLLRVLATVVMSLALIAGCTEDDGPTDPGEGDDGGGNVGVGSISGVVHRTGGFPVAGATITAGGAATTSNEDGYFVLTSVAAGEAVVAFASDGFMSTYRVVQLVDGGSSHLTGIVLVPFETATVNAATGGQVATADGVGMIEFQPGTIVSGSGGAYTGDVTVDLVAMQAGSADFYGAVPGLFVGQRESGGEVPLISYGFMTVELSSAGGTSLKLAAGATATLRLTIAEDRAASAPTVLPMWSFDPTDGRRHEDGAAILESDVYTAEVAHLSTWNWDRPVDDICTIVGTVVNDAQQPVAGARVISRSVDLAILDEVVSDATGIFEVQAARGSVTDLWAIGGSLTSEPIRVTVADDCPLVVPEPLVLTVPAYSFSLTWSDEPEDVDAHLLIPMTWDDAFDYYNIAYYSMGDLSDYPYAMLDTDDTSSYGPEIITGTRLFEGRYQYWVNNWSGDDTVELAASGAIVQLVIGGAIHLYEVAEVPLGGGDPSGWWHVVDIVVAGDVVTVQPVMQFQPAYSNVGVYAEETKARTK